MVPLGQLRTFETHLVSRATFGWTPETERDVLDAGWEAWLDRQLTPTTIPDPTVNRLLADYQTAPFYPVNLVLLPFDPLTAMGLFMVVHFALAGIFMYVEHVPSTRKRMAVSLRSE